MPNQSAHSFFELPSTEKVDDQFQRSLNDTLRQIAYQFDSLSTGRGVRTSSSSGGGGGSVTLTGGQLILSVPGTFGQRVNVAPLVSLPVDASPVRIIAELKRAPAGGQVKVQINLAGKKYTVVTIAESQTETDVSGSFAKIPANQLLTVDLVSVGLTFPGADLTLMLRF